MPVESPEADVETWLVRLAVALAIGLLIGVERGWKERGEADGGRTAGVRTLALIGLLGGVAALLSVTYGALILAVAFLAVAGGMACFEFMNARAAGTVDATPLIAQLLVFALGAAAGLGHLQLAGASAVAVAIILAFKENLHSWLERITFKELSAGLVLAAMTVIVLPLLPAEPVDPWDAVSPRDIWLLTLLIAAIQFAGYAAMRIIGPEHGPLAAGLAGGVVSSTATVLSFSRLAKGQDNPGPLAAGAVAANATMFVRIGAVASPAPRDRARGVSRHGACGAGQRYCGLVPDGASKASQGRANSGARQSTQPANGVLLRYPADGYLGGVRSSERDSGRSGHFGPCGCCGRRSSTRPTR
jgi:hypothetical protein